MGDPSLMPPGALLICARQSQPQIFSPVRGCDLEANRQAALCESAGNREGGQSPDVEGARVAQQFEFGGAQVVGSCFEVGDQRGGRGCGGCDQEIDICEGVTDAAAGLLQLAAVVDVVCGGGIRSR